MISQGSAISCDPKNLATAYDRLAAGYDALVAEDRWMRRVLWRHYRSVFAPGERVLDLGCGTGQDALFLARHGVRMTALDLSHEMLRRLRERAHDAGLADRIEICQGDAGRPVSWPPGEWAGIISSFAALNTVSDLSGLSAMAATRLESGGRMILHLLAPRGVGHGVGRGAAPGGSTGERLVSVGGLALEHRVLPAREVYRRFFRGEFDLRSIYPLGLLWPQSWGRWLPAGLAYFLGRLEPLVGGWGPLLDRGRFQVLDLRLRSST